MYWDNQINGRKKEILQCGDPAYGSTDILYRRYTPS